MAKPRRRVARLSMLLVAVSLLVTSPLLTLWSTTLLRAGSDPNQGVSLLAGLAARPLLQGAVAVSAALLLIFACNTALIGCYHVLIALGRLRFLPRILLATNTWRGTPQWSILLATFVPVVVVIGSGASTGLLGDLYAFGLLGAFAITCISIDIVRWHGRADMHSHQAVGPTSLPMFVVGVATTVLVAIPWLTNLFAKPLATAFGGSLVLIGVGVALVTSRLEHRRGRYLIFPSLQRADHPLILLSGGRGLAHGAVLVLLPRDPMRVPGVIANAVSAAHGRTVVFSYTPDAAPRLRPGFMEILDPYSDDEAAHNAFQQAEAAVRKNRLRARYVYVPSGTEPGVAERLQQELKPDVVVGS